jgi:hypothetical protein
MDDLPKHADGDNPKQSLMLYWKLFVAKEKAVHADIARRRPAAVAVVDGAAESLHNFFSHPAFAVILALVLAVFVSSGLISLTIGVSCGLLWLVAIVWLSRARWLKQLTIPTRALVILIAAGTLAFGCLRFRNWSLQNFLEQQIAEKHHEPASSSAMPEPSARPTPSQPSLPPPSATEVRPQPSELLKLDVTFKDSKLFTRKRRETINKDIQGFAAYLQALGLPIPLDLPPIGIDTTNPKGTGWVFNEQSNNKYYYNRFVLQQGILDDRLKVTEAFCAFVIGRFVYKPLSPSTFPDLEKQTPQQFYESTNTPEQMDRSYRSHASVTLEQYLNHSYWNRQFAKNQQPICPDQGDGTAYYFWKIRMRFGKEFANKLAVFTLRAVVDKPYTDPAQNYRQYFYERLKMADSVIDNENAKMPAIDEILKECGWLPN